jgi:iron(III) transport system ATP-binding protein
VIFDSQRTKGVQAAVDAKLTDQWHILANVTFQDAVITDNPQGTHDQVEAMSFSNQIAVIRDGRLIQVGSGTELYLRPKDDLTARFLGEAVLLPARLSGGMADCILGRIAVDDSYEGRGRIMLRPEQLQIDRLDPIDSEGAQWQVIQVDFEGFSSLVTILAIGAVSADEPRSLTVRGLSAPALELGAKIKITVLGRAHRMPS